MHSTGNPTGQCPPRAGAVEGRSQSHDEGATRTNQVVLVSILSYERCERLNRLTRGPLDREEARTSNHGSPVARAESMILGQSFKECKNTRLLKLTPNILIDLCLQVVPGHRYHISSSKDL